MIRPRRLSLRARMLVLLICVTTMFLIVLGTVSTLFISSHLSSQFSQDLVVIDQNLAVKADQPAGGSYQGYLAVRIIIVRAGAQIRQATVTPLTSPDQTRQLTGAVRQLAAQHMLRRHLTGVPFYLPRVSGPGLSGGSTLRAVASVSTPAVKNGRVTTSYVIAAQPVQSVTYQIRRFVIAELVTGGALIGLLAIGGEWLIGRGLEPLDKMTITANEITSRGDLTARMPESSDGTEVGSLGSAINTMLDRIQQAFGARQRSEQRVREFAADASHELRTPLTTIRGYAELYRQGALGEDQLPNAMRRIEQEAQRMSTLVAELLELARLDRVSSLDLAETDLASVVRDAVADAAAVEPARPVRAEAPPRLVAVVDERRIRQVLANLLGNVRAHTPVSTAVAVRLGEVSGGVLIEVSDAGPGMSGEDAARAFDRFHRAAERPDNDPAGESEPDPGGQSPGGRSSNGQVPPAAGGQRAVGVRDRPGTREWATGGSGLGLSIVHAIATAHGGQATLESWPGRGTRVRIWLPDRVPP